MIFQAFLRLLLLLSYPRLPCYGLDKSHPWKSPKNSTDTRRLLLVISVSGLNADDADIFSMPNLLHLRSHSSYPAFFVPQYPGTAAPNLFSMATGRYPENHGVLAEKVYDPRRGKMLTEKDPGYFTQNPLTIPIWTLNEYNHGVSACIMWPGCEVTVAGHKPTYHVPYNVSYSFTDLVDLVLSFASAKFAEEDYVKFVAGRAFEPASVVESAMMKSKDVNGIKETEHGSIRTGEEEKMKSVEHGDKRTDEEIVLTVEHDGNTAGEEEMVKAVEHGDNKTVDDKIEDGGKKTRAEEMMEAVEHSDKKTRKEDILESVNHSKDNTVGEEVMKVVKHSDEKTGDEEITQTSEHGVKTHDKKIMETAEPVGTETPDKKNMEAAEHGNEETGDREMNAIDNIDKKEDDGESVEVVEHGDPKIGGDEESTHSSEHSSDETLNRSRRDLRRGYGRVKRQDSWAHHYMASEWKQRYSSESEEKYQVVSVTTEHTNNKIKHIIDAHEKTVENEKNRFLYETFEEAANHSGNGHQNFTWHPYPFFKKLARSRVMYTLEHKARANLVMVRFDEPAKTARRYGPHSPQMMAALHTLDTGLLYLHLQLQRHHLQHNTDVILVSDQGTIPLGFNPSHTPHHKHRSSNNPKSKDDADYKKFIINLDTILEPSLYKTSGESPLLNVWPKPKKHAEVYNRLTNASDKHHFSVYGFENLPYDAYHFSTNPRISKILLEANPGYAFSDKIADRALPGRCERNISEGMPLMLAAGPSFRENFEGFTMQAVDLYPLMMEVLNIHDSPPINGSFALPSFLLKTFPLVIYNASWIFSVMAVIILVLLAALISCCFRHAKEPASPAPQRMSTIYRSTVEPDSSFVEYDVRVMPTTRGTRSRSSSADCVDGVRTSFTPARAGKGKAPPIPCKQSEEGEETRDESTDECARLLLKKASAENVK